MIFWLITLLMTALAVLCVLLPMRTRRSAVASAAYDCEVYVAQLQELDRDIERGSMPREDAELARAEIGRRLLEARSRLDGRATGSDTPQRVGVAVKTASLVALVVIPLSSFGLYSGLGSPATPDQPLAARLSVDPAKLQIEELVARAEVQLAKNPDDDRGWRVLAPIYMRLGRHEDAATAYRTLIRLSGASAEMQTGLAEAITAAAANVVTAEARSLFQSASQKEPSAIKPRFYLAMASAQEGDHAAAISSWQAILAASPDDAPWVPAVRSHLDESLKVAGLSGQQAEKGPTQQQMAAASTMNAEERQTMIEGMVAGLASRLKDEPNDVEGWLRLVRSYAVLGRLDEARKSVDEARKHLAGQSAALDRLSDLETELKLGRSG